ncbi:MAG: UvrABC system protein A [Phycisphaerae bacterium]|nr:UvrABC system protein A [Phycisphaerae bacterium]
MYLDLLKSRGLWPTPLCNSERSVSCDYIVSINIVPPTGNRIIEVRGARTHNLKNISLDMPRDALTVITGPSGSGKSSLAFDTLYAEGQRRYVESLSSYARQFLEQMPKPDCDHIEGLPPTVAIESALGGSASNPRSTVATITEIYDYLRALFARVGTPHCWKCGQPIAAHSVSQIIDTLLRDFTGQTLTLLAPLVQAKRGNHQPLLQRLRKQGLVRIRLNGQIVRLEDSLELPAHRNCTIEAVIDRLTIRNDIRARLADSIELALSLGQGVLLVTPYDPPASGPNGSSRATIDQRRSTGNDRPAMIDDPPTTIFTSQLVCIHHLDITIPELSPRLFSFNSPFGACPECDGLGTTLEFDEELLVPDPNLSLRQGAIDIWRQSGKKFGGAYRHMIKEFCDHFDVPDEAPFRNIAPDKRHILLHGSPNGSNGDTGAHFEGLIPSLKRRWAATDSEAVKQKLHSYLSETPCSHCAGSGLQPAARAIRIAGLSINEVTQRSVPAALDWLKSLQFTGEAALIAEPLTKAIANRLHFMIEVGVGYLTLDRRSATLSGGEAQRIRLATQVGSGLVGVCYVLDEPTIGLHPRDSARLVRTLQHLRDIGNTVIIVEHDEETIRAAEHLIDIGPGAGQHGGQIIAQGTLSEILRHPRSITGAFLSGARTIDRPETRRPINPGYCLEIRGAREHNLKNIDVRIPLGCFVAVSGVSGSGKSTLVNHILVRALKRKLYAAREKPGQFDRLVGSQHIDKVIEIDQSPIGRTPRSNPATYVGVFDLIRQLYAKTREAKIRGYSPSRFSFNVKGGRCEDCQGQGIKRIEMHFLPDMYVQCDACHGTRYNRETLDIRYRGKNIAEVLDLRIDEARLFFDSFPKIKQLLKTLTDVGMGYISLGQSSTTLSGGEAQRVKLAAELGKTATGQTLYVLDEPTTGLHFSDIQTLLSVLQRLVEQGNTVLVIEHNIDVIQMADWVIDLGPEGGEGGGNVIASGTPEELADCSASYTGGFLKQRTTPAKRTRNSPRAAASAR